MACLLWLVADEVLSSERLNLCDGLGIVGSAVVVVEPLRDSDDQWAHYFLYSDESNLGDVVGSATVL